MNPTNILYDFDDYSNLHALKNITTLLRRHVMQSNFESALIYVTLLFVLLITYYFYNKLEITHTLYEQSYKQFKKQTKRRNKKQYKKLCKNNVILQENHLLLQEIRNVCVCDELDENEQEYEHEYEQEYYEDEQQEYEENEDEYDEQQEYEDEYDEVDEQEQEQEYEIEYSPNGERITLHLPLNSLRERPNTNNTTTNTKCKCGNEHHSEFYHDGNYYCSVKCMEG